MESNKWPALGDFVTLQRGKTYKGALVGKPGPVLFGLGSIEPGGGFRASKLKTYGGDCPELLTLVPGDMYASLKGATKDGSMIGSVARVPSTIEKGRLTQDTVKLKFVDADEPLRRHIYWILRTPQCRSYYSNRATGSAQVGLSRDDFLAFPIPPITDVRKQLVDLFETIESKIELNRRMNNTLESTARELFKSWFVDFDPVIDNALAAGNPIPEPLIQRAQTRRDLGTKRKPLPKNIQKLFPDAFAFDDEMGWTPEGWEVSTIESVVSAIIDHRGKTPKKLGGDWQETGYPAISAKNVKRGRLVRHDTIRFVNQELYENWMKVPLAKGDVALTSEAPLGEAYYLLTRFDYVLSQRLFALRANNVDMTGCFLNQWLTSHRGQAALENRATGTTVVGIRQSELQKVELLCPPFEIIEKFSGLADPQLLQVARNDEQSHALAKLRDTLLPKLLSGELRIPDAEKLLAGSL